MTAIWLQKLWVVIKPLFAGGGNKYDFSGAFPNAKNVSIIFNPNGPGPVTVTQSGEHVALNPAQFPDQGAEISSILGALVEESGGFILEESALSTIENIQTNEGVESVKEELDYFRNIVPPQDVITLRACFYLRKIHAENKQPGEVARLKSQIGRLYGKRGSNMANLCTAGYCESWIRPLYEERVKTEGNKTVALEKFREVFNTIVNELPWTVFVGQTMAASDLEKQIIYKLEKNKSYGTDCLNIHALSVANVNKVRDVIPLIKQRYPNISKSVIEEGASIIVRLRMNPPSIDT